MLLDAIPKPPRAATPEVDAINALWTLRLRFGTLFGQLVTIAVVYWGMGIPLPLTSLLALIALSLLGHIVALFLMRGSMPPPAFVLPALMGLDVLHLTALLYLTGGPTNPFSFMYLVLIALATVVLPPRATWGLVALSLGCSAVLFVWHRPLDWHGTGTADPMRIHFYGMWVAFGVAAGFIVYFLLRIRRALSQREAELEVARALAARRDKLLSLATLAAGAAHELATPLGTIAIAAKELERQLRNFPEQHLALQDTQLIYAQVARCRGVLDQLSREAGDNRGESLIEITLFELLQAAVQDLPNTAPLHIQISSDAADLVFWLPQRSLAQVLRVLVQNALEASSPAQPVSLSAHRDATCVYITITDQGTGMSAEVLRRVGEPFFTTKPQGKGMGLGIFLCHAVVESLGGLLKFSSISGQGTQATVSLPLPAKFENTSNARLAAGKGTL